MQARREAERAEQERERAEALAALERKREEERDRLLAAVRAAQAGEAESEELSALVEALETAAGNAADRVASLEGILHQKRARLGAAHSELLRYLEARLQGLARAVVRRDLKSTDPTVHDVVFAAMMEDATAAGDEYLWTESTWDYCRAASRTSTPIESSLSILPMLTRYEEEHGWTLESTLGHEYGLTRIWGYAHTSAVLRERGLEAALQWVEQQPLDGIYQDPGVLSELASAASQDDATWERAREVARRVCFELPPRG
ncbi:MAG: hypothetical protein R3B99_20220 [Polyangiales bacterium]